MKLNIKLLFIISCAVIVSVTFASSAYAATASSSASASSTSASASSQASSTSNTSSSSTSSYMPTSSESYIDVSVGTSQPPASEGDKISPASTSSQDLDQTGSKDEIKINQEEITRLSEILEDHKARQDSLESRIQEIENRQVRIMNMFIINFILLGIILVLEIALLIRSNRSSRT